ncbi:hypothetical protein MUK42_01988 [Musa troglodytarum]|uniref:Uncharacterized protein n=1 Tax=Musa troglodytarum TaxID=320322 RepID=A0A9E7EME2_9LILI|nr:hypothetical protein MUK42_01988 [Musa troglodytarum]
MSTAACTRRRRRRKGGVGLLLTLQLLLSFWLYFQNTTAAAGPQLFLASSGSHSGDQASFIGRRPLPPRLFPTAGMEDSKRRVPSSSDPLHNR